MQISTFTDLLHAAHQQPQPQRLLFVFAEAGLPSESTPEQQQRYQSRQGGALTPIMCVDKLPADIPSFNHLVEESLQLGKPWDIVFVASLSGHQGVAPTPQDADKPLQQMVESINGGLIKNFLPFDRQGELVRFTS
ncbi:MAG: ribonucleotide reductase subunit alpha [Gammaproteobacteria bacterium]|nr:ribonucleotide reductase subunit alpha [Gammaproteobacteria bacterium]